MKCLLISLLAALTLPMGPLLSHGYNKNCSEECKDYYCPSKNLKGNKEEGIKNISSKE